MVILIHTRLTNLYNSKSSIVYLEKNCPVRTFGKEPLLVHDADRFPDILPVGISTRNDKQ